MDIISLDTVSGVCEDRGMVGEAGIINLTVEGDPQQRRVDPDARLDEIAELVYAQHPRGTGKRPLIRMRLQPQLYNPHLKQNVGWNHVSWSIETDATTLKRVRRILNKVFRAIYRVGPKEVTRALNDLLRRPSPVEGEIAVEDDAE